MNNKLVFIVENDLDEVIIETLAKRLVSPSLRFRTVQMGTLTAFHAAYISVIELLQQDPHYRFLILFDTNTTEVYEIDTYQNFIIEPLNRYGLLEYVTFCPIVPNLNAWLLDKYQLPERLFGQKYNLSKIAKVARNIDLNLLKRENASFRRFAKALQQVARPTERVLETAA
jgi:hypothetical protein